MLDRLITAVALVPWALGIGTGDPANVGQVVTSFTDPEIIESSALLRQDGLLITVNDSGDPGRVFAVDPATGRTVGVTTWANDAVDVEALAPAGNGEVWVGDIGDNLGFRDRIQVARVPVGRGERTVDVPRYDLAYPDGPMDAETLLCDPRDGRLYVVTKDAFGGRMFQAPAQLRTDQVNQLRLLGTVLPTSTDGAFFPDGQRFILRDYFQAAVYTFPGLQRVGSFQLPTQNQGEGLALVDGDTVWLSSEGQNAEVLQVAIPNRLTELAAGELGSGPVGTDPAMSDQPGQRPGWPWFLTGWAALGALVLFLRWSHRRPAPPPLPPDL